LFTFGLAVSPLSVCQETLIYTIFPSTGSVNLLLSLGLLAGKTTAFFASITAVPIADSFGEHAPFVVSSVLAGASFIASLILRRNLAAQTEPNDSEPLTEGNHPAVHRKIVHFSSIGTLGNVFWVYILV
jgi:dipeptide/tripeptide permease